jgi:hypothetical protein
MCLNISFSRLKVYKSRIRFAAYPSLKSQLLTLWTRSDYIESVGHICEQAVRQYLAAQKNRLMRKTNDKKQEGTTAFLSIFDYLLYLYGQTDQKTV